MPPFDFMRAVLRGDGANDGISACSGDLGEIRPQFRQQVQRPTDVEMAGISVKGPTIMSVAAIGSIAQPIRWIAGHQRWARMSPVMTFADAAKRYYRVRRKRSTGKNM